VSKQAINNLVINPIGFIPPACRVRHVDKASIGKLLEARVGEGIEESLAERRFQNTTDTKNTDEERVPTQKWTPTG